MPICFGKLAMTGQEIADATPWEITHRIDGYAARMKDKRIFTASFITAPVINSGMRAPKHGVKVEELITEDFRGHDGEAAAQIKKLIEEQEEKRRKNVAT